MTPERFDTERFDLARVDRVRLDDMPFGRGRTASIEVRVEGDAHARRFSRQITVDGQSNDARYGVYALECHFLRERATGNYFFLEKDVRGFYLYSIRFTGAETFLGSDARQIELWLARVARVHPRSSRAVRRESER